MARIKDIARIDRPREKLSRYGPDKLSDSELLAVLIGNGIKGCNVLELSKKVLKRIKEEKVDLISLQELKDIKGLGLTKRSKIIAAIEFGKRMLLGKKTRAILSPQDVWERMEDIRSSKKEHFVVFYLDNRDGEIKREIISIGTLTESIVHPREVFEGAIRNNASAIIVAHNHPSGNPEPSEEDLKVTKVLIEAGNILGIRIVDHVIVATGKNVCKSIMKEYLVGANRQY